MCFILYSSIGLHWWNKNSGKKKLTADSLLVKVMQSHCPKVFEVYGYKGLDIEMYK